MNEVLDLLAVIKFKNGILQKLMGEKSVAQLSRETGLCQNCIGKLGNLKARPTKKNGEYTITARKLAEHFNMLPEDLFPASLYELGLPKEMRREFSSERVQLTLAEARKQHLLSQYAESNIEKGMELEDLRKKIAEGFSTLKPQKRRALELRFGLDGKGERTLEEVGKELNVTTERARQVVVRGLREMRHPSRCRQLVDYIDIEDSF